MIITKYNKIDDMGFVSHKDVLKILQQGLKRMKIDVEYSHGYVPHMVTYITSPLPLGVQSKAEYFIVGCNGIEADEYYKRFNECMPKGLHAEYSKYIDKNPNLAALVVASEYNIKVSSGDAKKALDILGKDTYMVKTTKKGEEVIKEARKLIYSLNVKDDIITAVLATGDPNLRIDSFVDSLEINYEIKASKLDCVRTKQFIRDNNNLVTVEEYLNL